MELSYFINLTCIFALNVLFFFSGICLNCLVILSFWRSVQLRKKLCHFMIMVLSCCDLLVVSTNPFAALFTMLWLTEKFNAYHNWVYIFIRLSNIFIGSSLITLLVMNFDRYLATYYPLKHRTSVTKGKLLTLLAILIVVELTLYLISINGFLITHTVAILVCLIIISPPMLFINYKLFIIARKSRRNNRISPEMKNMCAWKNVPSCLLAVGCFVLLSIPAFIHTGLEITSKNKESTLDNALLAALWAKTIAAMNPTFNCLIFYWKNKTLRTEGMKVIKSIKICREDQS